MANEYRETPPDAAAQVAKLSRRTAHAAYALYACIRDCGGGPARAQEVVLWDREALSVHSTASGLTNARSAGLVERWASTGDIGVWTMTPHGGDLAEALEDRFLADTAEAEQDTPPYQGVAGEEEESR